MSGSWLQPVIIPTMILDSLENMGLKKGKKPLTKIPLGAQLLEAPAASKISRHIFCCLRDPELQVLHTDE